MKKGLILLVEVHVTAAPKEEIRTKSSNQNYRNNWDSIFGKKEDTSVN